MRKRVVGARADADGPRGPLVDPGAKMAKLEVAQGAPPLRVRRHDEVFIESPRELKEGAFLTVAGDDRGRMGAAPLQRRCLQVEPKTTLLALGTVARKAMLLEDGIDVTREIDRRGGGLGTSRDGERNQERHGPQKVLRTTATGYQADLPFGMPQSLRGVRRAVP